MAISVTQAFKDALKGPIDRSQIKVEVLFSGATYTDITTYVLSMSGTMEEANFEGGSAANTLNLTLNNGDGRFSRKNTASPYYASGAGLVPNKPIKVSIVVGSESVRFFTGYTSPWKTNALDKTCSVSAQDTARILVKQDVSAEETCFNATDPEFGRYLTRVIERGAYLAGLTWDAVTTLSADWTNLNPTGDGSDEVAGTYTEANLLTANQQGIETDLTGITKSTAHASVTISRVTTKYLRGAAALKVVKTVAGEQGGAYVNKTSGLLASTAYRGWVYLIADSTTPSVPVDVWLRDESNAVTGTKVSAILTPNSWTRVPVTITTGAGACSDLRLYAETTGATASLIFYADDFWMVKTAGTVAATYTLAGSPVMTLDLVDLLMPVTSLRGKCLKLLSDLAQVVDGKIYFDAQGQIVFRAAMYRNDSTLASSETFTVSSLEDVVAEANFEGGGQFAEIVNRAVVEAHPLDFIRNQNDEREPQDFNWSTFDKMLYGAGEIYPTAQDPDFVLKLPDDAVIWITTSPAYPEASQMSIRSAVSTDLASENGGISFYSGYPVFFPGHVKIKLQGGAASAILREIKLNAYAMTRIEGCRSVKKNAASITLYNQRDKDISNDHIPNTAAVERLAGWIVEDGREVKDVLNLQVMYGCPWLEINDRITASETITNTLPAAEDFIVKRIEWAWSLAVFAYTITACSRHVDFSPGSSLPASVSNVETRNLNQNVAKAGEIPPDAIRGTSGAVGLNNVGGLQDLVSKAKALASGMSDSYGIAFDGSDIYMAESNVGQTINRFDTMTGSNTWTASSLNASDSMYWVAISNNRLFVTDVANNTIQQRLTTAATAGSTALKASLGSRVPFEIFFIGGKMYVTTRHSGTSLAEICVWNNAKWDSATQYDTPDATYSLGTFTGYPVRCCTDGVSIYVPDWAHATIAKFNTSTLAVTSDVLDSSVTDGVTGVAHDGLYLWACTNTAKIAKLIPGTNGYTLRSNFTVPNNAVALLYDGSYLWGSADSKIYQVSTTGVLIATYVTGSINGGPFVFDGAAIWQSGGDATPYLYRIPRNTPGRQF